MTRVFNRSRNVEIAREVRQARSFVDRAKGLLGESGLSEGTALFLEGSPFIPVASIHTLFMRFAIDAVFVDRKLVVKAVYRSLPPWRVTRLVFGANSVIELPAGTLAKSAVEIGDQLHVGD